MGLLRPKRLTQLCETLKPPTRRTDRRRRASGAVVNTSLRLVARRLSKRPLAKTGPA